MNVVEVCPTRDSPSGAGRMTTDRAQRAAFTKSERTITIRATRPEPRDLCESFAEGRRAPSSKEGFRVCVHRHAARGRSRSDHGHGGLLTEVHGNGTYVLILDTISRTDVLVKYRAAPGWGQSGSIGRAAKEPSIGHRTLTAPRVGDLCAVPGAVRSGSLATNWLAREARRLRIRGGCPAQRRPPPLLRVGHLSCPRSGYSSALKSSKAH